MDKFPNSSNIIPPYKDELGYSGEKYHHKGISNHRYAKELHFKGENKLNYNFFNIPLREKIQKLPESS